MKKLIFILIALISFSQAQTIQTIGAPTTTVVSRGNFRTDSIFYLPKRTKAPTDTAAFRYQIPDSSLYYWTGYQWTKVQSASSFASVDTNIISTRAYRQKGDDSLGAIIATKGSGTVTSVATGYGLSGGTITTTGTLIADTLNLSTRAWRQKGLDSLAALEISGSGTTNYVPKFTNTREIGNSNLINASSGDLLFGTTLNPYAATNRRTFEINGTNETVIALKRNDFDGAYLYANANDFRIAQTQNLSMTFYTNNTERMRIFQNGRVFVGLSPTDAGYQFDVNGSGRFQQLTSSTNFLDFAHYFYNGGGTNDIYFSTRGNGAGSGNASLINTVSGARLSFHTNGGAIRFGNTSQTAATANYLSIESNGEILINTTTDAGAYTLQNNGALYNNDDIFIRGTYSPVAATNRGNITLNGTASNIIAFANNSALRGYIFHTDSDFLFYNNTTGGRVGLYTEGNARLWITASGNIGIGTTSPSTFLGSSGSMTIQGAIPGLLLSESGNLSGFFASNTTQLVIDARPTRDMDFQTNGIRRLRISNDGELLINTITDAGNYRVQVSGNAYVSGALDIGTTTNRAKMTLIANNEDAAYISNSGSNTIVQMSNNNTTGDLIYRLRQNAGAGNFFDIRYYGTSNYLGFDYGGNNAISISSDRLVGINTTSPSASAQLDVTSTTRGFLPPRMTTTQRDAISSPAAGLVIYNTTTSKLQVYTTSWTDLH
jgi:hypothetical protein